MRIKKNLVLPVVVAFVLAILLNWSFQYDVQAQEPPCPTNILAVAHHVGGWEDETRWITPTWEGGDWVFSSTVPANLTVPDEGVENWLDYWHEGSALRITEGTISVTHASYHCVDATEPEETPEEPEQPAEPNTQQRQACSEDCLPCPASLDEIKNLVGGSNGNWTAPEAEWGAWRFSASEPMTLAVPERGSLDWLDYWASKPVSASLGSIYVNEASYTCRPLVEETPEEPEEPESPAEPNTQQREACSQDCLPCPVTIDEINNLVGGENGNWTAPDSDWGAWSFTATNPMTLTVPQRGQLDWLDYWAGKPVSTSLGSIFVNEASYTCRPLIVENPEEPEEPQEPAGPNTEQREACSQDCPPCPATPQDVANLVSNGEGEWVTPDGPWGSWKFTSQTPVTLTVPLSGTFDFIDYWAGKPISTSIGLVTNVTEASYTCQAPQAPETVLVSIFMPQLAKANAAQEEDPDVEEPIEVPSGPVVQSPWSCFNSNEEAAAKLGGDYWNWAPPKESEPWASWVFHSEVPKQVCHPGGDFGGFLEHFSLGRLESGCFSQPIQDASFTCEDVED